MRLELGLGPSHVHGRRARANHGLGIGVAQAGQGVDRRIAAGLGDDLVGLGFDGRPGRPWATSTLHQGRVKQAPCKWACQQHAGIERPGGLTENHDPLRVPTKGRDVAPDPAQSFDEI